MLYYKRVICHKFSLTIYDEILTNLEKEHTAIFYEILTNFLCALLI